MNEDYKRFIKPVAYALVALLVLGTIFLAAVTVNAVKGWDGDNMNYAEISVRGEGEVFAKPDIATFTFTINEKGKTVKEAQDKATEKNNTAIKILKEKGIEEKDIKTTSYNINPQYEYSQSGVCTPYNCPPGKQVLTGYEVYQTTEVKVRKADTAGEMLTSIGSIGASYVSGLSFTIDDDATIIAEARAKAIADAKAKADKLAADLGVRLVRITSYYEDQGGYPYPMYERSAMDAKGGVAMNQAAVAPDLPSGENKYTSFVTINYRIK
jgi:uncharacterized protein